MKKNSCQYTEKIIAYRLGLLAAQEKEEFDRHLAQCAVCQRELQIESAIEQELAVELQPGFIEQRVRAQVQLRQAQRMTPFWLYALRMAVYGIVGCTIGLMVIRYVLTFPGVQLDIAQGFNALSSLTGSYTVPLIIGIGYVFIFVTSFYSLVHRRQ